MSSITAQSACPCTSGKTFAECCSPLLDGKRKAKTSEELLRSRYSAFVVSNIDYIVNTHHPKTRGELDRKEVESWSKQSKWEGLQVLQKEAGEASDETGTIIFHAKYVADGKTQDHYEKSFFEKDKGEWFFLDAQGIQTGPYVRQEPKVGRNDPCHCGSGKKLKKCHAA